MQTKNKNNPDSFTVQPEKTIREMELQARWDQLADGAVLTDVKGEKIQILSRGEWNHEAGPDFKNAKIRFRDQIFRGDIELHWKSSDYIRHGHLADAAYSNVILHIVAEDDLSGTEGAEALAHIPVCKIFPDALKLQTETACRCRIFPYMCQEQLRDFFTDAGLERLQTKSTAALEILIQSGTAAAFRQGLFRAAGYKRNQEEFQELLRRMAQYPEEVFNAHFEALLWGESFLLPDPAKTDLPEDIRKHVRSLWDEFWSCRLTASEPIHWKRDSVRPFNSPERRIAMLVQFLKTFSTDPLPELAAELNRQTPERFLKKLREKLNFSDPFWDSHCSFHARALPRKAAILGAERAETLLIDVIAPSLLAYAKLDNRKLSVAKASSLPSWIHAQKDNRVFKNAIRRWFPEKDSRLNIFNNAAMTQGCLHIYRQYCADAAGDCRACLLAGSIIE